MKPETSRPKIVARLQAEGWVSEGGAKNAMSPAKRLRAARIAANYKSARRAALAMGLIPESYNNHENGGRGFVRAAARYARFFKVNLEWLLEGRGEMKGRAHREVPLFGNVGAGAKIEPLDSLPLEYVEAPPDVSAATVAVNVIGHSMLPAIEAGTILYYSRQLPPSDLLNRRAIVKCVSGEVFVKILRRGVQENRYTLQSINPAFPDIEDVGIEWAAPIDWTRPPALMLKIP